MTEESSICELNIADGRRIIPDQRKKTFGMFNDIPMYIGYSLEETEQMMKFRFICTMLRPRYFSLSDIDETVSDYRLMHDCLLNRIWVVCE